MKKIEKDFKEIKPYGDGQEYKSVLKLQKATHNILRRNRRVIIHSIRQHHSLIHIADLRQHSRLVESIDIIQIQPCDLNHRVLFAFLGYFLL